MSLQHELGLPNPIEMLEHESVMSVVLTGQMMAKEGDRLLRPLGLTDSQFNILLLLKYQATKGDINQTQLGQMLLVNRSNVTGLVDRMEQAGWIERVGETGDRRVKRIRMTPAGRKLTDRAEKAYFERIRQVMGVLSPEEHRAVLKMMERLRERLRENA